MMMMFAISLAMAVLLDVPAPNPRNNLQVVAQPPSGTRIWDIVVTKDKQRFWAGLPIPNGMPLQTSGRELSLLREVRGREGRLTGYVGLYRGLERPISGWTVRYIDNHGAQLFEVDLSAYLTRRDVLDVSFSGGQLALVVFDEAVERGVNHPDLRVVVVDAWAIARGAEPVEEIWSVDKRRAVLLENGVIIAFSVEGHRSDRGSTVELTYAAVGDKLIGGSSGSITLDKRNVAPDPDELRTSITSVAGMPHIVISDAQGELGRIWTRYNERGAPYVKAAPYPICMSYIAALDRLMRVSTSKATRDSLRTMLEDLRSKDEGWLELEKDCGALAAKLTTVLEP